MLTFLFEKPLKIDLKGFGRFLAHNQPMVRKSLAHTKAFLSGKRVWWQNRLAVDLVRHKHSALSAKKLIFTNLVGSLRAENRPKSHDFFSDSRQQCWLPTLQFSAKTDKKSQS